MRCLVTTALLLSSTASATEDSKSLTIANERLVASVSKSRGYVNKLFLDGQNLLGTEDGNTGLL
jgi:rhamnogalacturonan endolyase